MYGELITANLYRMERGMSRLTAQNYYDPDCADVDIPLDVRLSPQENAAKYFKKYTRAESSPSVPASRGNSAPRRGCASLWGATTGKTTA